jgi:hypothetical protein
MTATRTQTNLTVENDTYLVTTTEYDDNGKPQGGHTESFSTQEEAEAFMAKTDEAPNQAQRSHGDDTSATEQQNLDQASATPNPGVERAASEMSEADAVALNADVHVATPGQSDRIVTDGEKEQVAAGLHPDPGKGDPLQTNKN